MNWASDDVVEQRPALSRWAADWKEMSAQWIAEDGGRVGSRGCFFDFIIFDISLMCLNYEQSFNNCNTEMRSIYPSTRSSLVYNKRTNTRVFQTSSPKKGKST